MQKGRKSEEERQRPDQAILVCSSWSRLRICLLCKGNYAEVVSARTLVYLPAVVEYLAAEVLKLVATLLVTARVFAKVNE